MLTDYFVLRRTKLDLDALYDPNGRYRGVNWIAMSAMALAVLPNLPGFINAAASVECFPEFFDRLYDYAWFTGVALSSLLYAVGMLLFQPERLSR